MCSDLSPGAPHTKQAPEARGTGEAKARAVHPLPPAPKEPLRGRTGGEKQRSSRVQAGNERALPGVEAGMCHVVRQACSWGEETAGAKGILAYFGSPLSPGPRANVYRKESGCRCDKERF